MKRSAKLAVAAIFGLVIVAVVAGVARLNEREVSVH